MAYVRINFTRRGWAWMSLGSMGSHCRQLQQMDEHLGMRVCCHGATLNWLSRASMTLPDSLKPDERDQRECDSWIACHKQGVSVKFVSDKYRHWLNMKLCWQKQKQQKQKPWGIWALRETEKHGNQGYRGNQGITAGPHTSACLSESFSVWPTPRGLWMINAHELCRTKSLITSLATLWEHCYLLRTPEKVTPDSTQQVVDTRYQIRDTRYEIQITREQKGICGPPTLSLSSQFPSR